MSSEKLVNALDIVGPFCRPSEERPGIMFDFSAPIITLYACDGNSYADATIMHENQPHKLDGAYMVPLLAIDHLVTILAANKSIKKIGIAVIDDCLFIETKSFTLRANIFKFSEIDPVVDALLGPINDVIDGYHIPDMTAAITALDQLVQPDITMRYNGRDAMEITYRGSDTVIASFSAIPTGGDVVNTTVSINRKALIEVLTVAREMSKRIINLTGESTPVFICGDYGSYDDYDYEEYDYRYLIAVAPLVP
jgi:hypothetical protein